MGDFFQSSLLHGHIGTSDLSGGNVNVFENIADIDNINAGF